MIEEKDIQVPVRDGARMALRIHRPEGSRPFRTLFATSDIAMTTTICPIR
jgi:predicted acyl esterase